MSGGRVKPVAGIRFECTACGRCCTGGGEYVIEARPREQEAIRAWLGISRAWFRRRYLFRFDRETESLRMAPNGDCVFLRDGRCGIYPVRPAQCRHYPFWPELVTRPWAWRAEARRCEGIGRGPRIAREDVLAHLAAQDETD